MLPMAPYKDEEREDEERGRLPRRGPRGGTTTATPDRVRVNLWIDRDVKERLRTEAYATGRTESELVRMALRRYYHMD